MKKQRWTAVVLAAGQGTRMKNPLPKVLHPVAGRPMIENVITNLREAGVEDIRLVVGHGENLVRAQVENLGVTCYKQVQQLGTGDAVRSAKIEEIEGHVLIMSGDHPLVQAHEIRQLMEEYFESKAELAVVTCVLKKPGSFGRIVRSGGALRAIVEAKDASMDTLKINEVNTGIYMVDADCLREVLPKVTNHNSKGEFYLTDIVSLSIEEQRQVVGLKGSRRLAFGVNTQTELSQATRYIYRQKAKELMEQGVIIIDPNCVYIEPQVTIGLGSVIYPNVMLKGETHLGSFCVVESNTSITDCEIQNSTQIKANSVLESSRIGEKCSVGPFARLRPDTVMEAGSSVGNFVELKKVKFGKGSKAGHLTYLGDAEVGENVNVGCGTITCNYAVDRKKYKTKIGNNVFVGSDTQFIAPVNIGDHAVIGSGSTITKDVPARALAVARGKQFVKENYVQELTESERES